MLGDYVSCSNKKSGETLVQYIILSIRELQKQRARSFCQYC
jgi:hypothetical protein